MSLRYSRLFGTASDAAGAVNLEIPTGFHFLKFKWIEYLHIIVEKFISKMETLNFGLIITETIVVLAGLLGQVHGLV